MRNRFYAYFTPLPLIALSFTGCKAIIPKETVPTQPNILLIMSDDMGYSDLGCYGSEISTPNIDKLAANGLRFKNFYNNTKSCPTRATLLTGLYNHEAGIGNMVSLSHGEITPGPYQGFLNENCVTLAEVLKEAGYSTYMSGKWHVGERREHWPLQRGFDKYFGLIGGGNSYFELIEDRMRQLVNENELWFPPADNFYMTQAFSDSAVAYLRSHFKNKKENPFFLYLAYTAPHFPLHALEEDIQKYAGRYDIGWDSLRNERYEKMKKLKIIDQNCKLSPRTAGIPAWDKVDDKPLWARRMQVYAAMIDRMDQGIGQVIDEIEKSGQLNNTIVIFLHDNGACATDASRRNLAVPGVPVGAKGSYDSYRAPWANASNTPYRYYKISLFEGGTRTPLIVQWPSLIKKGGGITDEFGHIIDIMPTLCEVAGTVYPGEFNGNSIKPLRGKSLIGAFSGKAIERTEPVFWEHVGGRALREGKWKLVSRRPGDPWELYDLENDPTELQNVSDANIEIVEKMSAAYGKLAGEIGVRPVAARSQE